MGQSIRCHKNINMWKIIIFSIIVTIVTSKDAAVKRKPKLFFVSTSSTTTTVSTRTLCYTTATTLTTCGRKKRAIGEIMDLEGEISPAPIQKISEEEVESLDDDLVTGGIL